MQCFVFVEMANFSTKVSKTVGVGLGKQTVTHAEWDFLPISQQHKSTERQCNFQKTQAQKTVVTTCNILQKLC